jgi:uncharacterized DUF497 family protein
VAAKIAEKHNVTEAEVKEAFELTRLLQSGWDFDSERGWRLLAVGRTYEGRVLNGVLYPADELDGTWWLGTAFPS